MMSIVDFTGMVASILPHSSEDRQSKATCQILHAITLVYCFNKIELDKVRYAIGKSFAKHIIRNKSIVNDMAEALSIVVPMACPGAIDAPDELLVLAKKHRIRVETLEAPRKKPFVVFYELRILVAFMEVVHKILDRLEPSDLQTLERGYHGHCHPSYVKPKRTLRSLFSTARSNSHLLGLAASELPGARARTKIVYEPAKFPAYPRLRTTSQSSGSTSLTTSTLPRYRSRTSSNASRVSRQSSTYGGQPVFMAHAAPFAMPAPVYTRQSMTYENDRRRTLERVYGHGYLSQPMRRS